MEREKMSKSAASGIVALIFLIVGFQSAVFFNKIFKTSDVGDSGLGKETSSSETFPDEVSLTPEVTSDNQSGNHNSGVQSSVKSEISGGESSSQRTKLGGYADKKKSDFRPRQYMSFEFDPNTVSESDLTRLGLTQRQAATIINYRQKGGIFRRKSDFKKMYVVSDTLYERLEPYITIPKLELNRADTSALKTLPGIGSFYAKRIFEYRQRLGGFVSTEQLLEVEGMTQERFDGLKDYIETDSTLITKIDLWHIAEDSLSNHPYINRYSAKGIVRYRECTDSLKWNVDSLISNGIISGSQVARLKSYL